MRGEGTERRKQAKQKSENNSRGGKQARKYLLKTNLKSPVGNSELGFITITDAAFPATVTFK